MADYTSTASQQQSSPGNATHNPGKTGSQDRVYVIFHKITSLYLVDIDHSSIRVLLSDDSLEPIVHPSDHESGPMMLKKTAYTEYCVCTFGFKPQHSQQTNGQTL